jgi:di/tricarboxylate transporter
VLMAIAINSGISAGSFAPTSLFGIVTYRIAREAGIDLNPFTLLAVASVANLALLMLALALFAGKRPAHADSGGAIVAGSSVVGETIAATDPIGPYQVATIACMVGLVASILGFALMGIEPDIGVLALGFGAVLVLLDPALGARAFSRIDWSTAFTVGGIVTFVGVLQKLGAVDMLGRGAMTLGTPLLAALVVCMIAALVSAFASTTGVLAALVPMAVPLALSGRIAGWALITALGVCATIVDASPFSNTGATLVASAADEDRPRLRSLLTRWGMAMVVVGPIVLVPLLVLFGRSWG